MAEAENIEEVAEQQSIEEVAEQQGIEEVAEQQDVKEEAEAPVEVEETTLAGDKLATLQQALDEAKAKECEYLDGWQRARAELANARKRFQREQELAYTNARADVLTRLLPIVDDFERAVETLPENLSGLTWIEGVMLILRKLQVLLDQDGVTPIEAVGQAFDPFAHQAVTHEPSEVVPEGHIIAELQRGYRMGDRVLRPSMVRVSSGSPPEPEAQPEPEDGELIEDDNSESS